MTDLVTLFQRSDFVSAHLPLNPGTQGLLDYTLFSAMTFFVEIRSYNLKPGNRQEFHRLFVETALPMLQRWKVDVVAYGLGLGRTQNETSMGGHVHPV